MCVCPNAKPINLDTAHIIDWRLPYQRPNVDMGMDMDMDMDVDVDIDVGHANGHMEKHITHMHVGKWEVLCPAAILSKLCVRGEMRGVVGMARETGPQCE